jgi:hypothetical protein
MSIRMSVMAWVLMGLTAVVRADEAGWKPAFEDSFERTEVGPAWSGPKLSIVDGRLYIPATGGVAAKINRPFAADVRVEFTAEADPKLPPCDLSVGLACGPYVGYSYLVGFGVRNNTANHIIGASRRAVDLKPPFTIEHGKKYRIAAVKDGRRLELWVDGRKLLETEDDDPAGGPGMEHVQLITWHGMYADDVKVYERATPAPDGPYILKKMPDFGFRWDNRTLAGEKPLTAPVDAAVNAYNARDYARAFDLAAGISPPTPESVSVLAYVVADVGYQERPGDQKKLAELAADAARRAPNDAQVRDLAQAAEWFSRISVTQRNRRCVTRLVLAGPENNPFYYKARLFLARFIYASALEGAQREAQQAALDMFKELHATWPEHPALREFTGESIPWGEELIRPESEGPAWARGLQETLARQHAILNWWFTKRQAPDGQLGGGWGDDVELMRSWVPVACITSAGETALAGIERLAAGIWDHVLVDGYDDSIGDVEHSAEPSCDTLPTMLLLRYGDPLWVERNLRSAKTIRERFMAVNERGFLQFISTEFGSLGINTTPGGGGDTGYHARAAKHFIWLAWYGIPEARNAFLQWCDTWRDATMRQIGTKPPGFAPPSLFYPSGGIDPPTGRAWHDEDGHYYGFPGLPTMVFDSFLTAYFLSGERKFLDPVQTMMDQATVGPLRRLDLTKPRDNPENLLATQAHTATQRITAVYKWLTGERVYDEYTLRGPSPTQRYQIDYDLEAYGSYFVKLARSMRVNIARRTSEVLQTDRAGLQGAWDVLGAYTGAVRDFVDGATPTLAVTWDTPDLNYAALVTEATSERLRVRLYNFNNQPMRVGLRPWRLVPGKYVLNGGEPVPGEQPVQSRYTWGEPVEVEHRCRGTPISIEVPSRKEWVVDLRLKKAIDRPRDLPDLAIHARDIRHDAGSGKLMVTVHNIGATVAGPFAVGVAQHGVAKPTQSVRVEGLPAISKFEPVTREIALPVDGLKGTCRVILDVDLEIEEIYEGNNVATIELR